VFQQHAFQITPAQYFPATHPNWIGRGVAIVVFGGAYSIDLFFMISAFLITQILLREQQATGAVHIRRFYIRRILRIWPLYFTYIALLAMLNFSGPHLRTPTNWLLMFALLSGNVAYALWGWAPQFLTWQLWSIAVEEQFYLIWPLIVGRSRARGLVIAALAMLSISILARAGCWFISAPSSIVWTNTLTRLDTLAAGILIGVWMMGKRFRASAITRAMLLLAGIATILVVEGTCDHLRSPATGLMLFAGYPAACLGCAMILFAFLGINISMTHRITRAAIYLGKISYGLYIWHLLALTLTMKALARPIPFAGDWIESSTFTALCALALTIAMATVSYEFLERPFLRLKSRYALIPSRPT